MINSHVTVNIDNKLHFLAKMYAKQMGITLSELVEILLADDLASKQKLKEAEFNVSLSNKKWPLWNEHLWSELDSDRIFNLAQGFSHLMSRGERKLWGMYERFVFATKIESTKEAFNSFCKTLEKE